MAADLELLMNNAMEGWSGVIKPQRYSCPVHGLHPDWVQFNWSQRAGLSNLLCLRCIESYLEARIPGVVVTGTGPGGGGGGGTVTSTPRLLFSASPTSIGSGGSAVLTWSTVNATSVVASGGWSGNRALSGSASTGVLSATTAYTLMAAGPGGSVSRSATVTVTPALFSNDVQVTTGSPGGGVVGFDSASTPAFGSVAPATLPTGGSATGQAIIAILSGPTDELWVAAAYAATNTQLNQFDSVHVTDDHGVVRTYLASAATFTLNSAGSSDWVWYGSNPVMATSGKAYTFTFTKA